MIIKKAESDEEIKQCLEIRCKVFVEGQGVPIEDEVDDKDAESVHYLLFINGWFYVKDDLFFFASHCPNALMPLMPQ